MQEVGKVIQIKNEFVTVRIGRHSACGECGKCGFTENQRHVDFYVKNTLGAKIGDSVAVDIKDINTIKLAAVAYILPMIGALLLFLVSVLLNWPIWTSLLMFVCGLVLAYVAVAIIDKRKKHKWMQSPEMVKIIKNGGNSDESN
ncbi:MAG: SoxR reducing system RseC family protein [Corallococcus sp.]|nr:SoxR reducing system RseC family protein [Corallococcus sp.]